MKFAKSILFILLFFCSSLSFAQYTDNEGLLLKAVYDTLPDTLYWEHETVSEATLLETYSRIEKIDLRWKVGYKPHVLKEGYQGYQEPIYKTIPVKKEVYYIPQNELFRDSVTPHFKIITPRKDSTVYKTVFIGSGNIFLVKRTNYLGQISTNCFDQSGLDTCRWKKIVIKDPVRRVIDRLIPLKEAVKEKTSMSTKDTVYLKQVVDHIATQQQPVCQKLITVEPKYIYLLGVKYIFSPETTREIDCGHDEYTTITRKKYIGAGLTRFAYKFAQSKHSPQ